MAQTDKIKKSIAELADIFHARVAVMHKDLELAESGDTSAPAVESDFNSFKMFVLKALDSLQSQVEVVAGLVDAMEMRSRRKMLLLHGVKGPTSNSEAEDTTSLVVEKLKIVGGDVTAADIKHSHRLGKPRGNKPQPILIKFRDESVRDELWFGKVALKGSGVTMGEFLTKPRHDIFVAARERLGVRSCWTRNGDVYALDAAKVRHHVTSLAQLQTISAASSAPATTRNPVAKKAPAASSGPVKQAGKQAADRTKRNNRQ